MRAALAAALCASALGCLSLEREAPFVRTYAISARAAPGPPGRGTLAIGRVDVSPRFARREFVYRQTDVLYETDFYHLFLAEPAVLIREELERGLRGSRLFEHVGSASLLPGAELRMDASVEALYGDYRSPEAPRAVLTLRVIARDASGALILDRTYAPELPLRGADRPELVRGWETALERILAELASDFRRRDAEARRGSAP